MTPSSRRDNASEAVLRPTIVIAAHNEEAVIATCLDSLLGQGVQPQQIVVVANGCDDLTADLARAAGVNVIDRPKPGKAGALNAGDGLAQTFPRIYLDADIVVPDGAIEALVHRLDQVPGLLAVVPRRRLNTAGRQWPVRAYFSINERLPAFRTGLFGRGLIAVAERGRARFDLFPEMVADDLFLDSQFDETEKAEVGEVTVVVEAPFTTRELLNRLVRVRRGNAQMRAAAAEGTVQIDVRPSDRRAWLRVALAHPTLWINALAYVWITLVAARRARRTTDNSVSWAQDSSTRVRAAAPTERTIR